MKYKKKHHASFDTCFSLYASVVFMFTRFDPCGDDDKNSITVMEADQVSRPPAGESRTAQLKLFVGHSCG